MPRRPLPEWLFLLSLSAVAGLAELAFVVVNISSLPLFLEKGLGLASLPGIAMAVFYTAEAAGNSPMGALADRLGRRRLMVMGTLLSVATCVGTAFLRLPDNNSSGAIGVGLLVAMLLAMRALDGLGAAMLWPSVFASVADRCAPDRQARAMTVLNVTYLAGIAVGPLAAGLMNDHFGGQYPITDPHRYAPSFFFAGGCFLLASLLSFLTAPGRVARPAGAPAEGAAFDVRSLGKALRRVPALMVLGFLIFLAVGLIGPYAKSYFMDRFHMTESGFGTALLLPALLIGAVSVPLGHLSDRWGKTRAIKLGMGLCAAALWGIQVAASQVSVVLLGTLLGVGFVLSFPSYMAYLSNLADPHERGGLIGAVRLAQGTGAFTGAGLASLLHVHHAGNQLVFLMASTLLTLGFGMALMVLRETSPASGERKSES